MKLLTFIVLTVLVAAAAFRNVNNSSPDISKLAFAEDNGGITLPEGFKAVVVADSLGQARHLTVRKNGDVYIKLERVRNGCGIVRLQDSNGDGVADNISGFGTYGGTGIAIKNGYLYASSNS